MTSKRRVYLCRVMLDVQVFTAIVCSALGINLLIPKMGSRVGRLFIIIFRRNAMPPLLPFPPTETKTTRYNYPRTHQLLMISKTEMGSYHDRLPNFISWLGQKRSVLFSRRGHKDTVGAGGFSQKFWLRLIASGRSITPPSAHIPRQLSKWWFLRSQTQR